MKIFKKVIAVGLLMMGGVVIGISYQAIFPEVHEQKSQKSQIRELNLNGASPMKPN